MTSFRPPRTVEFSVPRLAGDALRSTEIAEAARAAGCDRTEFEYRIDNESDDTAVIVADYTVVPFIIDAFIATAKASRGATAAAAGLAAFAGLQVVAP